MESSYCCHAFAQMACAIITIMMQRYKKRFKTDTIFREKTHFPNVALSIVYTKNTEKVKKIWNFKKLFLSLQRE